MRARGLSARETFRSGSGIQIHLAETQPEPLAGGPGANVAPAWRVGAVTVPPQSLTGGASTYAIKSQKNARGGIEPASLTLRKGALPLG